MVTYQILQRSWKEDRVEIPAVHMARHGGGIMAGKEWTRSKTPMRGVRRRWQGSWREYLGHTVVFQDRKHFKDKKSHYVSKITGRYLRTRRKLWSLIRKPLIMSRIGRMSADTRTDGEKHIPWQGWCIVPIAGQKYYVHRVNNGKRITICLFCPYSRFRLEHSARHSTGLCEILWWSWW